MQPNQPLFASQAACLRRRQFQLGGYVLAILIAGHLAQAQSYTYVVGQNVGPFDGRQLRAGESLYIPTGVQAFFIFQVVGPGVIIVNDGDWDPSQSALEYGATLTNNGTLSATFLQVRSGRFVNRGKATYQDLSVEPGAFIENQGGAFLTVTREFQNRGAFVNCGATVFERYALYPGGTEQVCTDAAPGPPPPAGNPLPVTLVAFTGRAVGGKVLLEWKMASELNASHYEVERSANGQVFAEVGRIAARGLSSYSYTDQASPGLVYYRLRSVDTDGAFAYSPVVVITGSELVRRTYYNEIGQRLAGPGHGFYLEVAEYENGAVERKKYVGQ